MYAFDSTTIELCLAVFCWRHSERRRTVFHTLHDIETQVPMFFHITLASVDDMKAMPEIHRSVYEVLKVLGISLTDTTPLKDLFNKSNFNIDKEHDGVYEPPLLAV